MRQIGLIFAFILIISALQAQVISIEEAREKPLDTEVTVSGIVTNGDELGTIRYMQDETAGIAVYDSDFTQANRGDSITVTGPLYEYNNLLEMEVTDYTIHSSNNELPDPVTLTPAQLAEEYEAQLITIENVTFEDGGATFQGNTGYTFSGNGESANIYVRSNHPLIGEVIPAAPVNITGLVSQFSYDDPNSGYQLILRDANDIEPTSTIFLTSAPVVTNISQSGFDVSWTTGTEGSTYLITGSDENSLNDTLQIDENVTEHTASVSGKNPASMVYYKAMSFNAEDTVESPLRVAATQSESSGEIKVYFTNETEDSVASAATATTLAGTAHDTLVKYIERAEESIDFAIYNHTDLGSLAIVNALNDAYERGVDIRIVTTGGNNYPPFDNLNSNIHINPRPDEGYGIMHNKFLVFDAHHSNPDKALVWTGSANFTNPNIFRDANNIIIVQDQSLAKAYELEFEEMWGAEGLTPDAANARFGDEKKDNTPHKFIIGDKRVEAYFSPSDNVNAQIIDAIDNARNNLSIGTMLITRSDLAYSIENAYSSGVKTNVITNSDGSNSDLVENLLSETLGVHYTHDDITAGMLHDKYMIADEGHSNALVLTGSHNWSNSANERNDENTLIIHDEKVANLYFQSFTKRFLDNNGSFNELNEPPVARNDTIEAEPQSDVYVSVLDNDELAGDVDLEIIGDANNGNAYISFTDATVVGYRADEGFAGMDSVKYEISYKTQPELTDEAWIFFDVRSSSSISKVDRVNRIKIYPNPGSGQFNISVVNNKPFPAQMQILNIQGKRLYEFENLMMNAGKTTLQIDLDELSNGIYIVKIISENYVHTKKLFIR